jgi:hypothetical protein
MEDFLTTEYSASNTFDGEVARFVLLPTSFKIKPVNSMNTPATKAMAHAPNKRMSPKNEKTILSRGFLGLLGRLSNKR